MSWTFWQQEVVVSLRELSDSERQKRWWLDRDGPPFPSPVELVCGLFLDSGFEDMREAGEVFFSPECDALLEELSRMVDAVSFDQPYKSLLEDHAWIEAGSMAKVVLRKIERISNGADASDR
jgi:hypothetical protein